MHPFRIERDAIPGGMVIAGGTDIVQLLRAGVLKPDTLRSLDVATRQHVTVTGGMLRLPALATMAQVGSNADVRRGWPAISDALLAAASPQVRNLGTVGGNLMQRTRCLYFRDPAFPCNKRQAGSGCPAIPGRNRELAILGTSASCIATHPSDMPVALTAFDAVIETDSGRSIPIDEFYRLPGHTPWLETVLRPNEIITAILVPASPAAARSTYVKVRDRQSYAYALASIAAGMHIEAGLVRDVRVAAGGVGTKPWRLPAVEDALRGKPPTPDNIRDAAALAAVMAIEAVLAPPIVRLIDQWYMALFFHDTAALPQVP